MLEPLVIDLPSPIVSRVIRKLTIVAVMEREMFEDLEQPILAALYFGGGVIAPHVVQPFYRNVFCKPIHPGDDFDIMGPTSRRPDCEQQYFADTGVLAPNGCVYLAPYDALKVICVTAEGLVKTMGPDINGNRKYGGPGILAPNGCIYFAPTAAAQVLCITAEGSVETVGPGLPGWQSYKYSGGGVLAPNGCIYFAPNEAARVLCITAGDLVQTLGPELYEAAKYAEGVLAANGNIYFAPAILDTKLNGPFRVLCITTEGIVQTVGPEMKATDTWGAGVLAPNDSIYFHRCVVLTMCCASQQKAAWGHWVLNWTPVTLGEWAYWQPMAVFIFHPSVPGECYASQQRALWSHLVLKSLDFL